MRDLFHRQLDVLVLQLARMCDLTAIALRRATTALLSGDLALAEQVIADDATIDQARARVEHDVQLLLALQSPVATDLRVIVSTTRAATRLERMGDLAGHVAVAVRRRNPVLASELHPRFAHMAEIAVQAAVTAGRAVRGADPLPLNELLAADDELDDLHRSLFVVVGCDEWRHGTVAAVDAVLLSRYYERFTDHAVSVARLFPTAPERPILDTGVPGSLVGVTASSCEGTGHAHQKCSCHRHGCRGSGDHLPLAAQ